ncbi:DinB family protein [Paenibacillus chondroitinus]|uniref:DinB family protein n=1 Tax=Paenibacillus chondroitinus TaxID=59842 RepID=A0ABU6DKZ7_9BACL|nr:MULTISPECIES: DinB family protein [Paenibacillus]MCY9660397.1 DinB family protein [Paenibacillus anseongense]MEB4798324.1 DinB family protein [Paenibacillus chondroitinus]
MREQTIKTYDYHAWANKKVFERLAELPEEVLHQELGNVFPTIYNGLVHIYQVDAVWLSGMMGNSYEQIIELLGTIEAKTAGKSLEELQAVYWEKAEEYRVFLHGVDDLEAKKQFPHPTFGVLNASIQELIQHIVNHGTYHRGNISSMLRQLGHAGASSDWVFYLYEVNK